MADPKAPERWWFCPDCGLRDAHRHDVGAHDDCSECGMDCWRESQLSEMLLKAGRHIVSEAERKVLEACAEIPKASLEACVDDAEITPDWYLDLARAELARRKP